ncbi:MAG TPA: MBL fold metallo-hydrolase [Cerasibacillus sp.]|uniref:MBL fold metallo-hydrolase n=1 Tax=Cerasibacillus sp. TaxID=2498711 RepID=UPI002F40CA01
MKIKQMPLGPLGTNCYIVYKGDVALIIDPGGDEKEVISFIDQYQLKPLAILLTHAHFDHIGAVGALRHLYDIDVYLGKDEQEWLENPHLNRSTLMGMEIRTESPEHLLTPGKLNIDDFSIDVLHTPGHSPGSSSFVFTDDELVISGDVLFRHGVGRTDLPGGSFVQLQSSILNHLYHLPDHFIVYPGHGPKTTIGEEKQHNPFVPGQV